MLQRRDGQSGREEARQRTSNLAILERHVHHAVGVRGIHPFPRWCAMKEHEGRHCFKKRKTLRLRANPSSARRKFLSVVVGSSFPFLRSFQGPLGQKTHTHKPRKDCETKTFRGNAFGDSGNSQQPNCSNLNLLRSSRLEISILVWTTAPTYHGSRGWVFSHAASTRCAGDRTYAIIAMHNSAESGWGGRTICRFASWSLQFNPQPNRVTQF